MIQVIIFFYQEMCLRESATDFFITFMLFNDVMSMIIS